MELTWACLTITKAFYKVQLEGLTMLLCNFNVNDLFARYKFGKTFPDDMSQKSV